MPEYPERSILLITVAIAPIVIGTGSVVGGAIKMYTSQARENSGQGGLTNCPMVETGYDTYELRCPRCYESDNVWVFEKPEDTITKVVLHLRGLRV